MRRRRLLAVHRPPDRRVVAACVERLRRLDVRAGTARRRPSPSGERPASRRRRRPASRPPGHRDRPRLGLERGVDRDDHRAEHRVHDGGRHRPGRHAVHDRVRQRGRRGPAQRRDQGRQRRRACSRARSSPASTTRTYDVPALDAGRVHVRVHRPPEHDRHADRPVARRPRMTPTGEQLCYTDAYARSVEARVARGRAGRGDPRRPRPDGLLPGRRRPAVGSRAAAAHGRRPVLDRPGGPQGRRRDRPRARARRRRPAGGRRRRCEVDLDWARRLALMRTHTALHALCGVVWRDYGALVTGGNMEPGRGADGLRVRADVGRPRRRDRGDRQRRAGRRARRPGQRPAARRGVRHPGPDPDEGQPAARRGSRRSGRSRSSGSTSRPTAAPTSPTPARSARSG